MGSLPNLHELGKDDSSRTCSSMMSQPHSYPIQAHDVDKIGKPLLHRHSTNCRSKSRTCLQNKIVCDDFTLEQMAAYSPISSRSTRNLTHCNNATTTIPTSMRRRDSMNSSIGATSVRRLIGVVRHHHHAINSQSAGGRYGPVYSRRVLIRNLVLLAIAHFLITATFLPFLALQGSVSAWNRPLGNDPVAVSVNVGSLLLSLLYALAAVSCLYAPPLVQKLTTNCTLASTYAAFALFYAVHVYPLLYALVPVYVALGLLLGPSTMARVNQLMTVSSKLSYVFSDDDDDAKYARHTTVVRRAARTLQAAQDFGFIFGSVLSAALIAYTINLTASDGAVNGTIANNESALLCARNCTSECCAYDGSARNRTTQHEYAAYLDDIFDVDEFGERLCGAAACPSTFALTYNASDVARYRPVLPEPTASILAGVYAALSLTALTICVVGMDKIRMYVHQDPLERSAGLAALRAVKESFKDPKLQLSAPLAIFIGMEQAFMYADFSKSYVVCTLGIHRLNLVFLCMGLLQSIAACTLSMLLRTIRRYYVIAVGFTFHACLLMVQMLWKPIGDDPALFYVISAAWGVCNAIWEMLSFTLLTGLYADNWETPFANAYGFRYVGMSMAFLLHGTLCNWLKLYLLALSMVVAVVPFAWLEVRLENIRKVRNISRL